MSIKTALAACATFAVLGFSSVSALADDHAFTEGPVVNIARIRTVDGKFDDYVNHPALKGRSLGGEILSRLG